MNEEYTKTFNNYEDMIVYSAKNYEDSKTISSFKNNTITVKKTKDFTLR